MKIERKYIVGIQNIGINKKLTNYSLLGFLEEIGCIHSDMVGLGVNDIETTKKAWVLMNWKLKVFERPKYGDELLFKTWARKSQKNSFYTYRDFEVYLNDEKIAIATSKWVLFDIEKNKITKISDEIFAKYENEDTTVFDIEDILKLKEPEEFKTNTIYEVKRFDIDINKHMHNLNYLRVAYEALPEDIFLNNEKENVEIMYKHQIVYGQKLNCYYTNKEKKEIITIKNEDNSILHAIIELY